jgi:hypothetical protein
MSFPDYVTLHWPDPGQPVLRRGVRFGRLPTASALWVRIQQRRLTTPGSWQVGYAEAYRGEARVPSNVSSVPGNTPVWKTC